MLPKTVMLPYFKPVLYSELKDNKELAKVLLKILLTQHYADYIRERIPGVNARRAIDIYHDPFDDDLQIQPSVVVLGHDLKQSMKSDDKVRNAVQSIMYDVYTYHHNPKGGNVATGIGFVPKHSEEGFLELLEHIYKNRDKNVPYMQYIVNNKNDKAILVSHKGFRVPKEYEDYESYEQNRKLAKKTVNEFMESLPLESKKKKKNKGIITTSIS